ncbi:conserved domain protein [Streptococcus constellatus subsp. pharyngis SK1060 = CCUG 46377]|uniref:Conserved domain protein n=1 Tax=Streptococcus constellatus subsp. pharyngis SK1060 = CCUG 46377 TaxID=1035184 RepID=F9P8Z2_STRCV|nr:conserved domain protein [Streptococcus constellatus subsp. pharyngis SK1060 = CCUG 46377]
MTNKKIKLTADTIPNALAIASAKLGKMLNTNRIKEKNTQNIASLI